MKKNRNTIKLLQGDCLQEMDKLIKSGITVDAIITDPPYGTTICKWDSVIPFEPMWERLNKLIKPNGAIVLFGSEPFSSLLRVSNLDGYKYDWVWKKNKICGFNLAKNKPLTITENISMFSTGLLNTNNIDKKMKYYPQGVTKISKSVKNCKRGVHTTVGKLQYKTGHYKQEESNYPKNIIDIQSESRCVHPTQKPVPLLQYLIRTYTNEEETVLDFTMGSGTTGVACKKLNRNFIGIELDGKYFKVAEKRINRAMKGLVLKL